jgi:hypothetical protein
MTSGDTTSRVRRNLTSAPAACGYRIGKSFARPGA